VKREWLAAYLQKPSPLRPFGFHPGTGSRMPDFKLTPDESAHLADYLFQQKEKRQSNAQTFQPQTLSVFSKNKTRQLLDDKLACLGCHQLGEHGGRIGPSFNQLNQRLQSEFVYRMIAEPQHAAERAIMPKIPMPQKTRALLANFLMQHESTATSSYLSLIDHAPAPLHDENPTRALYLKHCAACHGREGEGKGYNASFLPKAPIAHNDSAYMSSRPDDTLYDGIHAGGFILNKSHTMPAWGETLTHEEIQSLVGYLRKLCRCEGPSWARDNR
jgi:mono/diheme cytochrome c family protein